jgi:hypothetical protein
MAQRTSNNPPFGYKVMGNVIDDITELFTLTGGTPGLTETIGDVTNPTYSFEPTDNGHSALNTAEYGAILGGQGHTIDGGQYSAIVGGRVNSISGNSANFIGAGLNNVIGSGTGGCGIIGGELHNIETGSRNVIVGGRNGDINGFSDVVILGGNGITATASDTIYVSNLNYNGNISQAADVSHELGDLQFKLDSGTSTYTSNFSDTKAGEKLFVIGADASNIDLTDISNTLLETAVSKVGVVGTYINMSSWDGKSGIANVTINNGELTLNGDTFVKITSLPTHADEAAAVTAGLATDTIYKTATGELRIKL